MTNQKEIGMQTSCNRISVPYKLAFQHFSVILQMHGNLTTKTHKRRYKFDNYDDFLFIRKYKISIKLEFERFLSDMARHSWKL